MSDRVVLIMNGIHKAFDKVIALEDVHFELAEREIHGLLGGNGAGKTTLMNILYGMYRMDGGEIILNDKKVTIQAPRDALNQHIGMVHQHFLQIGSYTVLENVILGTRVERPVGMKLESETQKLKELCQRFGLEIDLQAYIEDLPMGTRQKVEILKALYRGVKILILDEPTTNLTPQEVDALFQTLRVMVNEGLSIVFITHKIREVLSVCDRISVLRNGKNVVTMERSQASEEAFVRAMVGEEMNIQDSILFSKGTQVAEIKPGAEVVLSAAEVEVVTSEGVTPIKNLSLQVHAGEILGVAGVAGNGQRELAECLMGILPLHKGSIQAAGMDVAHTPTRTLIMNGVVYIPEDRLHDGFLPRANVAQNLILGFHRQQPYARRGMIDWNRVDEVSRQLITEYNIKTEGPRDPGGNLSGGNIQRVMIARAFSKPAKLLIAHNPTRGLDIPSMDFVYSKLLEGKQRSMATLLISEDLDELLLMCDRIAALYRGEILGVLPRDRFDKYEIGRLMSGIRSDQ